MKDRRGFPFSIGCMSQSAVAVADPLDKKASVPALQQQQAGNPSSSSTTTQGCSTQPEKPKVETEADGVPQVWAEAVKTDPADVIPLPYVVPF